MKKIWFFIPFIISVYALTLTATAQTGDMGFFGGITEGTRLPTTIEQMLVVKKPNSRTVAAQEYREVVFLTGVPTEIEGLLTVREQGAIDDTKTSGTYKVTYQVTPIAGNADSIARNITFNVNWRREGNQLIKNYTISAWAEVVRVGGQVFTVDAGRSHFNVSLLLDVQPAVTYVKGDLSVRVRYIDGVAPAITETYYDANGTLTAYESAWSNTETMRIDGEITRTDFQISFQVRPSVSVNKTLQYSKNEQVAISFDGNYREVSQNKSGLFYDVFNSPISLPPGTPLQGGANISVYNIFEQLPKVEMAALKANVAATDIHKLFSMGVLEGPTTQFDPTQRTKRGEFVTMLVKAAKIPITPVTTAAARTTARNKNTVIEFTFPDVLPSRPDYPYIMAAYEAGIAGGRGGGLFYADYPIQREEAIYMMVMALGLENLGLEPTPATQFSDDAEISSWAKKAIYAAQRIGIIGGDENGQLSPRQDISKAEAAALVNAFIEYMRSELALDYAEHLVNYTD